MLNRKFASIRANVKVDKRNSPAQNQRLSQSQSMEMQSNYQRTQNINNNNILMNLSKEASVRSMSSHDRRLEFDSSPVATPVRSPLMKSSPQHPYVNLLHHQQPYSNNNIPPYQLQYQTNASTPESVNQSWNLQNAPQPIAQHYTAAQIYMRPKVNANAASGYNNNQQQQQSPSAYSSVSKKPPPPEVPKRLSSSISIGSTSSLKKSNGLSRSSNWS